MQSKRREDIQKSIHWGRWLIAIMILLVVGISFYGLHGWHSTVKKMNGNQVTHNKLIKAKKPFSVLVMGTDVGALGRGTSYAGNTDTMEVITVNPDQKGITMVAIPRDTLVKVTTKKETKYVKINAAYAIGGAKLAKQQVSELLGVPIDYYALVNMGTLQKVVDAVGGVRVNNPFAFTYEGHHFKKGWQHLNGKEALKYSRMRYDDPNNDYGRQKRGQQVITSIIQTFKEKGSVKSANKIIMAVQDGVLTDIPLNNIASIYLNYRQSMNHIKKDHLQGKNAKIDGSDFQIASSSEINRVSAVLRKALGLKTKKVMNNETQMDEQQTTWNGYNNLNFVLPQGAEYNVWTSNE